MKHLEIKPTIKLTDLLRLWKEKFSGSMQMSDIVDYVNEGWLECFASDTGEKVYRITKDSVLTSMNFVIRKKSGQLKESAYYLGVWSDGAVVTKAERERFEREVLNSATDDKPLSGGDLELPEGHIGYADIVIEVLNQFWSTYDTTDESTFPSEDDVISWILKTYTSRKLTRSMAKKIADVARGGCTRKAGRPRNS